MTTNAPPITGADDLIASDDDGIAASARSLLVPIHEDWFLLDMRIVLEVVAAPEVTALPTAPRCVMGLFNMRGEIVPLLDTGDLLGLRSMRTAPYALVIETPHGPAGLALSGVPESVDLGPAIGRGDLAGTTTTHGFGRRMAAVLDIAILLDPARIGVS